MMVLSLVTACLQSTLAGHAATCDRAEIYAAALAQTRGVFYLCEVRAGISVKVQTLDRCAGIAQQFLCSYMGA